MTGAAERIERPGVVDAARALELHPFEVVRILAVAGELPADLRLDPARVRRVAELGGLERWWRADPEPEPGETMALALLRHLAGELLAHAIIEPAVTRADNLFRGLGPELQPTLRRAVNLLIREGWLLARMDALGLTVTARADALGALRELSATGTGPLARVAERV